MRRGVYSARTASFVRVLRLAFYFILFFVTIVYVASIFRLILAFLSSFFSFFFLRKEANSLLLGSDRWNT